MTLHEFRRRLASDRNDPIAWAWLLGELTRLTTPVVRRYSTRVYAGGVSWSDALEDLVAEVVTYLLLGERQLDYILDTASDESHMSALLVRQVKRQLGRRRMVTVVDNLIGRCRQILDEEPFEAPETGVYRLSGVGIATISPALDAELRAAAMEVARFPRQSSSGDRAPTVYSTEILKRVLKVVAQLLPNGFTIRDLDAIFRLVLTDWFPSFLEGDEETLPVEIGLLTEEESEVTETKERILAECTDEHLFVLRGKFDSRSDGDLARELGVSRPTLAKRKEEVLGLMERELIGLSEAVQTAVMAEINAHLAGMSRA